MSTPSFSAVIPQLLPPSMPSALQGIVARVMGLSSLENAYQQLADSPRTGTMASRLLQHLDIRYRISDVDIARIPRAGSVIAVANHPFGLLDGVILYDLLNGLRPDVKVLANGVLNVIPEVRDFVIEVDLASSRSAAHRNARCLRNAYEHLASGGVLVVFPAGEVSHFNWHTRSVIDREWNGVAARLAAMLSRNGRDAFVLPMFIEGANSTSFQAAGVIHPRLRTLLLGRELLNKRGLTIGVHAGAPVPAKRLMDIPDAERTAYLRWRSDVLAPLPPSAPGKNSQRQPLAPAVDPESLRSDVERLPSTALLASAGDLKCFIASGREIPNLLLEIGRLRELTFRAVGEGAGSSVDIDEFDSHYLHLFLWDAAKNQIAGAYRLAGTDRVRTLYTATLFDYRAVFLRNISPALELGRSFIRPEYQKSFHPLLLLWKGIGRYVADNPRYKVLFGPVSISNDYHPISRELMVTWLERYASLPAWRKLVRARNPFRRGKSPSAISLASELDHLAAAVQEIEPAQRGVPVLLRQYLKLGGKLLAFNVDRNFSNALDGLILVDLTKTDRKLLDRYLGAAESAAFLEYQKGTYAA